MGVEELRDLLLELDREKFDLHVHARGDLAVKRVLDAVEAAKGIAGGDYYPRVTISHLGIIDPVDLTPYQENWVLSVITRRGGSRPASPIP